MASFVDNIYSPNTIVRAERYNSIQLHFEVNVNMKQPAGIVFTPMFEFLHTYTHTASAHNSQFVNASFSLSEKICAAILVHQKMYGCTLLCCLANDVTSPIQCNVGLMSGERKMTTVQTYGYGVTSLKMVTIRGTYSFLFLFIFFCFPPHTFINFTNCVQIYGLFAICVCVVLIP